MTHIQRTRKSPPADPPVHPDSGDDTGIEPGRGATAGPPRWVVVLAIGIGIVLVGLFFALHLTGTLGPGAH